MSKMTLKFFLKTHETYVIENSQRISYVNMENFMYMSIYGKVKRKNKQYKGKWTRTCCQETRKF